MFSENTYWLSYKYPNIIENRNKHTVVRSGCFSTLYISQGRLDTMISQDVFVYRFVLVSITIAYAYFDDAVINGLATATQPFRQLDYSITICPLTHVGLVYGRHCATIRTYVKVGVYPSIYTAMMIAYFSCPVLEISS